MKQRRRHSVAHVCVISCAVALSLFGTALADPIDPGFDYFLTPAGGANIDLGSGPIPLEGVPLPYFRLGLTDTVVARMDPGPPEGGVGVVDIELVALHLKSVGPVLTPSGPADLHVTIDSSEFFYSNPPPSNPAFSIHPDGTGTGGSLFNLPTVPNLRSIGLMELTHDPPGPTHSGADMRACFGDMDCAGTTFGMGLGVPGGGIYASLFFVTPGGDPSDPMDVIMAMPAPRVIMSSLGRYLHTAFEPEEYGGVALLTAAHDGPHPHPQPVPDDIVPEPSSVLLALSGLLAGGLAGNCRRRIA
jgi:hypothetical protein